MINTKRLRCIIGWLGMLLPWIVLIQSLVFGYKFPNSISATYFRDTCITPFMIILGSAGILLFTYDGYDKVDDVLNTFAGIFGLGICIFPCGATAAPLAGTFQLPTATSNTIHMISAIGFFGILAYNSLFQFTKGVQNPTANKKKRNVIFRICGIGMIVSFILLPLTSYGIIKIPHVVWVIETIALTFFGISWLTKANRYRWLFADND
jgi:hypothetical protein